MKKRLAMRIASFALCVVFTGMLFGAPKSKAVATEVAIGTAAVASYWQATGLTMAASAGSTGALVTAGIGDVVGSYAMATGVASSGSAFLSSVAAGVSISPAGVLVLTAASVALIGGLVAWYIHENRLEEPGDTAVAVPGTADSYLYNGVELSSIDTVWTPDLQDIYRYVVIAFDKNKNQYKLYFTVVKPIDKGTYLLIDGIDPNYPYVSSYDATSKSWGDPSSPYSTSIYYSHQTFVWSNFDVLRANGEVMCTASNPVASGDVSNQLEVTRTPEFTQPDVGLDPESAAQMMIDLGYPAGTTLEQVAEDVPAQIAAGTLEPTYEMTEPGEGSEPVPDTGIYIPILSDIVDILSSLANSIIEGIKDLFTPSQAAVDSLSAEVDAKLPLIATLRGFGGNLIYNLEHPEACANGLGLTTIVDLEKGRGTYLGNTKHELLDVSWYLEYKPLVDDIIVGFCWLCFLWNCYGALPRIIHGEGSVVKVASILQETLEGDDDP